MRKRVCSGILFLLLMILMVTPVFAADMRASDKFANYNAKLYVESNGDFDIYFSVTASGTMDILGASKIVVERTNGYRWAAECTLTVQYAPEMQATNASRHSAWISYEPNDPNANYRAIVTLYAEDSTGSSTA